jgi:hypothetical protein
LQKIINSRERQRCSEGSFVKSVEANMNKNNSKMLLPSALELFVDTQITTLIAGEEPASGWGY